MKAQNNKLSQELQLLVLSIRVSLKGEEREQFKEALLAAGLNWKRVNALINYHQIIPVFYSACSEVSFRNEYRTRFS